MNDKVDKLIKVKAIVAFREKHLITEMEATLKVLQGIRDGGGKDADKVNASKEIGWIIGWRKSDKASDRKKEMKPKESDYKLTPGEDDRLEELLNGKSKILP